MTSTTPVEIVSAHSPDSDDAFMFYGLATKKVRSPKVVFRHILEDIETLNRKAMEGQYELTAISYHAYPYVADKYVLMASGSSIGDGYGPMIVATRPMEPEEIRGKCIAIPGTLTTAYDLAIALRGQHIHTQRELRSLRIRFHVKSLYRRRVPMHHYRAVKLT